MLLSPPPMHRYTEKEMKEEIATPPTVAGSADSSDILQASPVNGPPRELLLPSFSTESDTMSDSSPRSVILRARFDASPSSGLIIEERRLPVRIILRPRMSQLDRILMPKEDTPSEISLNYNLSPLLDMDLDDDSGQEETKEEEPDDDMDFIHRASNPYMRRVYMSSFSSGGSFDTTANKAEQHTRLEEQQPQVLQTQIQTSADHYYEAFDHPRKSKTIMEDWQDMFFNCFSCTGWTQSRWPSRPQQSHWPNQTNSPPISTFTADDFGVAIPTRNGGRHAYI